MSEGQAYKVRLQEVYNLEARPSLKCVDLSADGQPWRGSTEAVPELSEIFWDTTGQKEKDLVKRRQYSSDATTSLNGNADREARQPDSLVRGGSLQAGEDLPGGVSVPGALAGSCNQNSQRKERGRVGVGWGSWEQRRGRGGFMAVLEEILITELPYFKF